MADATAEQEQAVPALARSSDGAYAVEFDACPFFAGAEDQEIVELAKRDFSGGYPAELVVQRCLDGDEQLVALLGYLALAQEQNPSLRLDCRVEREPALAWLKDNRPQLAARVERRPEVDAAIERRLQALDQRRS